MGCSRLAQLGDSARMWGEGLGAAGMKVLIAAFCLAAGCFAVAQEAAAQPRPGKRVALVIGNSAYVNLTALENPARDARAVAALLRKHGFQVLDGYDLDRNGLLDLLEAFRRDYADGASETLVFYAGHGMAVERDDVLAPVDMSFDCVKRTALRTVKLEELHKALGDAPRQAVVLDACRNDAFKGCRAAGAGEGFRGLSRDAAAGVQQLTVNSTLTGKVAADGAGGAHSPFAAAMLARLEAGPSTPLRDVFDAVAADVSAATGGGQVPEVIVRGGAPKMCLAAEGCGAGGDWPDGVSSAVRPQPKPQPKPRQEATVDAPASGLTEESLRDFFLGVWRVDQRGSGTLITYYKDGTFQGMQYGGGPARTRGRWRLEPIGPNVFQLFLNYDKLPSWRGTFKIIDRDRIHNIDQNYIATRER